MLRNFRQLERAPTPAEIEARYPPTGLLLRIPGGRLHALHRQDAGVPCDPAVVLLHGASGNASDLGLDLFEALSRRSRVFSVDRPGHGWSSRPGGAADADPARQADLVLEGLMHAAVRRCILVAHSWSGGLALNLALRRPDVVKGVVLVAAATHPWPGGAISWYHSVGAHDRIGEMFAKVAPLAAPLLAPSALRAVFHPQRPPADFIERTAVPLLFRPSQFRANAQDMAGLHGFLAAQAPLYPRLAVPVVTIVSDMDRIVPMAHGEELARQSGMVRLKVLRGFGHMLQHVAVPAVVSAVGEILEDVRSGARAVRRPVDA